MKVTAINNRLLLEPYVEAGSKLAPPSIQDCLVDDHVVMRVMDVAVGLNGFQPGQLVILHGSQLDLFTINGETFATALAGAVIAIVSL